MKERGRAECFQRKGMMLAGLGKGTRHSLVRLQPGSRAPASQGLTRPQWGPRPVAFHP